MKKIITGILLASLLITNYIFPTTINITSYGTQIQFFNGEGIFIEK